MAIPLAVGLEPIPGYRLESRLGSGGYGEVWKVIAPGGIGKALKVVFGDHSGPRAEQELRALERIKSVRHPFVLSLERFEVVGGQLLIITELADRSLMQRFQECRDGGLPGIPRDELLRYMHEATGALDYINEAYNLQHLDIKPENLLLVGPHIKVADFGLVKNLHGASARLTGGVTPLYAPPEAFDGRVTRFSDQYSLAIVFQEMLTGYRPYAGQSPLQLITQHTTGIPNLTPLPPPDRPIIDRALSKIPEARFPLCRHLAEALQASGQQPAAQASMSSTAIDLTVAPPVQPRPSGLVKTLPNNPSLPARSPLDQTRLVPPAPPSNGVESLPFPSLRHLETPAPSATTPNRQTVFIGLGGVAGRTLRKVKHRLRGSEAARDANLGRFLIIDTDSTAVRRLQESQGQGAFLREEVLHCPLHGPEHYRDDSAKYVRWLNRRWLFGIPRSCQTEGLRPLGRLAFADHEEEIKAGLRYVLDRGSSEADRGPPPRVVLVSSLTGGCGSGMLVDVAYLVRQVLEEMQWPADEVRGMLMFASGPLPDEQGRAKVNAYATLQELWHFDQLRYDGDRPSVAPFSDCYLLWQAEHGDGSFPSETLECLIDQTAEYLCFDTTLGTAKLDRLRQRNRQTQVLQELDLTSLYQTPRMTVRSSGLAGLRFPREELIHLATEQLARRLLESWQQERPVGAQELLVQDIRQQVESLELTEERLLKRFHGLLPQLLTREAEQLYGEIADPQGTPPAVASGEGRQQLARIDTHFGKGSETAGALVATVSFVELSFRAKTKSLAADLGKMMTRYLVNLVETPGIRLQGAGIAHEILAGQIQHEMETCRGQLDKLQLTRRLHRRKIDNRETRDTGLVPTRLRQLFQRGDAGDRPLWNYLCLRLEELLQENTLAILQSLQAQLQHWGRTLHDARRALHGYLVIAEASAKGQAREQSSALAAVPYLDLYPFQAKTLAAAAAALPAQMPADFLSVLEGTLQKEVLAPKGGLWALLTSNSDLQQRIVLLNPALRKHITRIAEDTLKDVDLLAVLRQLGLDGEPLRLLLEDRSLAARMLAPQTGRFEHVVLAVPAGERSQPLRAAALDAIQGPNVTLIESGEALLISWETAGLSLPAIAARLAEGDPSVIDVAQKVHTRHDINWTSFEPAVSTTRQPL